MDRFCTVCFPSGAQLCFLQAKDVTTGAPHPGYLLWCTAMLKASLPNFDQKLYDGAKKTFLDTSSVKACILLYLSELLRPFSDKMFCYCCLKTFWLQCFRLFDLPA